MLPVEPLHLSRFFHRILLGFYVIDQDKLQSKRKKSFYLFYSYKCGLYLYLHTLPLNKIQTPN